MFQSLSLKLVLLFSKRVPGLLPSLSYCPINWKTPQYTLQYYQSVTLTPERTLKHAVSWVHDEPYKELYHRYRPLTASRVDEARPVYYCNLLFGSCEGSVQIGAWSHSHLPRRAKKRNALYMQREWRSPGSVIQERFSKVHVREPITPYQCLPAKSISTLA